MRSSSRNWLNRSTPPHVTTLVVVAGIAALNMNILLPSLPSISKNFNVDYSTVQLAISAYLGVTALLQIIIGPLSDRFGRRPVILWGMAGFLLATLGCILSTTIEAFLAFRMLQSVIAAGMVLSRAIVRDMVPPEKAASMIGYITMGMSLVPMTGPAIGGVLNEIYGWQASFVMVLLLGMSAWLLCWLDLGETNKTKTASFRAQFRAYPSLLRSRRFWGYTLTAGFASGAFFAFLGGAPFVSTQVLGLSSTQMGLYFILVAGGYMTGNFLTGRFSVRYGLNKLMLLGSCVTLAGTLIAFGLFAAGLIHPLSLFGPMLIVGIGNGLTLPSANAGIVSVRPHLAGSASGIGGAMIIGNGALVSAATGAMLSIQTPVYPLLFTMFLVSVLAVFSTVYVIWVAQNFGSLDLDT